MYNPKENKKQYNFRIFKLRFTFFMSNKIKVKTILADSLDSVANSRNSVWKFTALTNIYVSFLGLEETYLSDDVRYFFIGGRGDSTTTELPPILYLPTLYLRFLSMFGTSLKNKKSSISKSCDSTIVLSDVQMFMRPFVFNVHSQH